MAPTRRKINSKRDKVYVPNTLKTGIGDSVVRAKEDAARMAIGDIAKEAPKPRGIFDFGKSKGSITNRFLKQTKREFGPRTTPYKAVSAMIGGAAKGTKMLGKGLLGGAKLGARAYRSTPRPVKVGGMIAGAVAMLGVSMLKGALNQSREIVYERYMQDAAVSKNMLNNTRLGLASGTSRMQNYGSTMGLSNAMSRTRHGGM